MAYKTIIVCCLILLTACVEEKYQNLEEEYIQKLDWHLVTEINLTDSEEAYLDSINLFCHELIKQVAIQRENKDFCISPVGLSIYFSMLTNGLSGESHDQLLNLLHVTDINVLNSINKKLLQYLPCDKNESSIYINNRFWIARYIKVSDSFISKIKRIYNADVVSVDFNDPTTIQKINNWSCESTNGLICSILDGDWKDYVSTSFISANSFYFKGDWESKFSIEETKNEIFHSSFGDVEMPMMHKDIITSYSEIDGIQMLKLKFNGYKNQMEFFLPNIEMELKDVADILTPDMQKSFLQSSTACHVKFSLPLFRICNEIEISSILQNMGLSNLDNFDFSPIGLGCLPINTKHRTYIEIDEDGAEMAAITHDWSSALWGDDDLKCVNINFDRPFIYIIRNVATGAILMAGAVTEPQ